MKKYFAAVAVAVVLLIGTNVQALDIFEVDYDGTTTLWWFHQKDNVKTQLYSTLDYDWVKGLAGPAVKAGKWNLSLLGGFKVCQQESKTTPTHGCLSFSALGKTAGIKVLFVQSFDKGLEGRDDYVFTTLRVTKGKFGLRLKEFQTEPFHFPRVAGPTVLWPVSGVQTVEVFWGVDVKDRLKKTLWVSYVHVLP